jgi:hypothetical protein
MPIENGKLSEMPYDKEFPLEFWGQALLNAAAWHRQMEWLMRLTPTSNPLTVSSSGAAANGEIAPAGGHQVQRPKEGVDSTSNDLYENWLKLCGWVPRRQYENLQARFAALEKRYLQQSEMIARMRQERGVDPQILFDGFSQFFTRQSGEFSRLVDKMREIGASPVSPQESGGKSADPEA